MPIQRGSQKVIKRYRGSQEILASYRGESPVWKLVSTVKITGTSGYVSRDQFRQACINHGVTYDSVEDLPFVLDTSEAVNIDHMFNGCTALKSVHPLETSNITSMAFLFMNCSSLTQGSVSLIGRHPQVSTSSFDFGTSLPSRPPFENIFEIAVPRTTLSNRAWTTVSSHVIAQGIAARQRTIHFQARWGNPNGSKGSRVLLNGSVVAQIGPSATSVTDVYFVANCAPGDTIAFQCYADSTTASNRVLWETSYCGIYTR